MRGGVGGGQYAAEVEPSPHQNAYIYAEPAFVSRPEGRISVVFSLRKTRPVQVVVHPLSEGFPKDDNEPGVWDGIPEFP